MGKTRQELWNAMGALPNVPKTISAKQLSIEMRDSLIIERLILDLNGYEQVPAIFIRPKNNVALYPVVLFNHSHGNLFHIGKTELLDGCDYMLKQGYAYTLAEAGIASLSIDHMCFEERRGLTESFIYKKLLWDGYYMWAWMVFDSIRALDYLTTRNDVDTNRIATIGMSMGSYMAQWVAALDERIKVCIDICCLTNFDELVAQNLLDQHGVYYYIPGFRKKFTTAQLNALIAPRAHLSLVGEYDPHTPMRGIKHDEAEIRNAYKQYGVESNWELMRYPVGHIETYEMRVDAMRFLKDHL